MRAFRPSLFGLLEEQVLNPAEEVERVEKIEVYAKRAHDRVPLFQDSADSRPDRSRSED